MSLPWFLALITGFLSVSQELLWVRILGFSFSGLPQAFGFVLTVFLLGIAAGAALGRRICARSPELMLPAAALLAAAGLLDALTPKLVCASMTAADPNVGVPGALILTGAALKSGMFPIVHQLGAQSRASVGRSIAWIYFGNILGSATGPLLTGFIALDAMTVEDCFLASASACLLASAACAFRSASRQRWLVPVTGTVLAAAGALPVMGREADGVLGALAHRNTGSFTHFVANRHGVVHTTSGIAGDVVYGGNIYDGLAVVDVDRNANRLDRLYLLAMVHPHPKRALVIGMATGAWTRALEGFDTLESIDVVEINPAYLRVLRDYGTLAPVLRDPRVHVHIDDGRRWLKRNPDARFDLIVQNTTFHWRANTTGLLSREYFLEIRAHLAAGGVFTANTTGSYDVLATGAAAFPHAWRYANFIYASERPLEPSMGGLEKVHRPDGRALLAPDAAPGSVLGRLRHARLEDAADFCRRRGARAQVITDDNLLPEYAHAPGDTPFVLTALHRQGPHFAPDDP